MIPIGSPRPRHRNDVRWLATQRDHDIAAQTPCPHEYAAIYSCVAWPYWFGEHANKPLDVQLRRLRARFPHLRPGRSIMSAALASRPRLPPELWQHVYTFAGDDVIDTVHIAIAVAKQRHTG